MGVVWLTVCFMCGLFVWFVRGLRLRVCCSIYECVLFVINCVVLYDLVVCFCVFVIVYAPLFMLCLVVGVCCAFIVSVCLFECNYVLCL